MVRGSDSKTLDGITEGWFTETSKLLRTGRYNFKPARRVYIPKANGKVRPIGISSPRDKIIQQSFRIIMEIVLEPKFLPTSHGFRPKRGCHSALKTLRNWKAVPWVVEGDIKSYFDSIDHMLLGSFILKHFQEDRLIVTYRKLVKAGYIEFSAGKKRFVASDIGVPQGGILSPLLSNLFLHELDLFMEEVVGKAEKENQGLPKTLPNPEYRKISRRIYLLDRRKKTLKSLGLHLSRAERLERLDLITKRRRTKTTLPNPDAFRLEYVRYADDWLVGVWGTKALALDTKNQISNLLSSLNLELSEEKTLITNTRKDKAKFLGTHIQRLASATKTPFMLNKKGHSVRQPTGNLWLSAPISALIYRLCKKKFLAVVNQRKRPLIVNNFLALPVKDLILWYRSILNGFLNYYSFADNRPLLSTIHWILKESLAKTIRRKESMGKRLFLRKFGKDITLKILRRDGKLVKLDFQCPPLLRNPLDFRGTEYHRDPLARKNWKISTISALGQPCANCGSSNQIEMHHIKNIRTINVKLDSFSKMMARVNRKQIPLCHSCHLRVHNGTYLGMSIRHFNYIKWEGQAKWS